MIGLMVLHWGIVRRTIVVSDLPPTGVVRDDVDAVKIEPAAGRSRVRTAVARGGSHPSKGSA